MSIFNPKEDAQAAKPLIDALVSEAEAAGSRLLTQAEAAGSRLLSRVPALLQSAVSGLGVTVQVDRKPLE